MNENLWRNGFLQKVAAAILVITAFIMHAHLPPPEGLPPHAPLENIPALVAGAGIVLFIIGFALETIAYMATRVKLDLMLTVEAFEIGRNVMITMVVVSIVVTAGLLSYTGMLPVEDLVKLLMFIVGAVIGGVAGYYASRRA